METPPNYWLSRPRENQFFSRRADGPQHPSLQGQRFFAKSEYYDLDLHHDCYLLRVESLTNRYVLMVCSSPPPEAMTWKSFAPTHALRNHWAAAGSQRPPDALSNRIHLSSAGAKPSLLQAAQEAALTLHPPFYLSAIQGEASYFWIRMTNPFLRKSRQLNNVIKKFYCLLNIKYLSKICHLAMIITINNHQQQNSHN